MITNTRGKRNKNDNRRHNQVNLVSARSRSNSEVHKLSRLNVADGYTKIRKKRALKKRIFTIIGIAVPSLILAVAAGIAIWVVILGNNLSINPGTGKSEDFDALVEDGTLVKHEPEKPFWMLLIGTDEEDGVSRSDTLILVYVDQPNNTAAMLSIPRDTWVDIPGYSGKQKINAAYSLAEQEEKGSGYKLALQTVSQFTGVQISYVAQIGFDGIIEMVDALGGVEVDVPVDIIGDYNAGGIDIYSGLQTLDGHAALVFCRSRQFEIGDYQRQANQRTFLQALAKQILSADLSTIANTVTKMTEMTFTNLDIPKIIAIAQDMKGLDVSDIHTYHMPSTTHEEHDANGVLINSYVIADRDKLTDIIAAIESGNYPPAQTDDSWSGITPDSYAAGSTVASDNSNVVASQYVVDVKNGSGVDGSATAISDKLVLCGYKKGEIGNADAYVYEETYIIYRDADGRAVANDIKTRIGYGKVVEDSAAQYKFTGDVLVVVGQDYRG